MHEKYIESKSEKYFGKKLRFKLNDTPPVIKKEESKIPQETSSQKEPRIPASDPYEDIIINELGGEKVE